MRECCLLAKLVAFLSSKALILVLCNTNYHLHALLACMFSITAMLLSGTGPPLLLLFLASAFRYAMHALLGVLALWPQRCLLSGASGRYVLHELSCIHQLCMVCPVCGGISLHKVSLSLFLLQFHGIHGGSLAWQYHAHTALVTLHS